MIDFSPIFTLTKPNLYLNFSMHRASFTPDINQTLSSTVGIQWNCPVSKNILPHIDWPNLTFVRIAKLLKFPQHFLGSLTNSLSEWQLFKSQITKFATFFNKFFVWMPTFQISNHQICHIFYKFSKNPLKSSFLFVNFGPWSSNFRNFNPLRC